MIHPHRKLNNLNSHNHHQLNRRRGNPIPLSLEVEMIYPKSSGGIVNIKMVSFKESVIYNLSGKKVLRSKDNRIDIQFMNDDIFSEIITKESWIPYKESLPKDKKCMFIQDLDRECVFLINL